MKIAESLSHANFEMQDGSKNALFEFLVFSNNMKFI